MYLNAAVSTHLCTYSCCPEKLTIINNVQFFIFSQESSYTGINGDKLGNSAKDLIPETGMLVVLKVEGK